MAASAQLEAVKGNQCRDWEWYSFNSEAYSSPLEAAKQFFDAVFHPPLFSVGKVVLCHGQPLETGVSGSSLKAAREMQSKIAKELGSIPDNVLLVIMAKPDKGNPLYKAFKSLEGKGLARVDEKFELNKGNAVEWIQMKARAMGLEIDKVACQMLADITSFNPSSICAELHKLKHLSDDHQVSARLIEFACFGPGFADVFELGKHVLANRPNEAHELLQRLLDAGEPPLKICGWLQDWIQKTAIVESCGGNLDEIKSSLSEATKWDKLEGDSGEKERVHSDKWGRFVRPKGESIPLYANLNAFFYLCNEFSGKKRPGWAYDALRGMGKLQIGLRTKEYNQDAQMHVYLASLMDQ